MKNRALPTNSGHGERVNYGSSKLGGHMQTRKNPEARSVRLSGRRWPAQALKLGAVSVVAAGLVAGMSAAASASSRRPSSAAQAPTVGHASRLPRLAGPTGKGGWFHRTRTHQESLRQPASALPLVYANGPVMLSTVTYALYWEPAKLQNGAASTVPSNYNSLMTQFFKDVGGHGLYTDLTQYYQITSGVKQYVQNSSVFGGSVVDTDPFPKASSQCAGETNCVGLAQLQAELEHEMSLQGWKAGPTHAFFIYTSPNEDSCDSSGCAYSPSTGYCATHYNAPVSGVQVIFSVLPYNIPAFCGNYQGSSNTLLPSPNGNQSIDGQIDNTIHELMESITDPVNGTGWTDSGGNEVADKCQTSYTPLTWDSGHANEAANGHFYMEQDMFDNHNLTCVQLGP